MCWTSAIRPLQPDLLTVVQLCVLLHCDSIKVKTFCCRQLQLAGVTLCTPVQDNLLQPNTQCPVMSTFFWRFSTSMGDAPMCRHPDQSPPTGKNGLPVRPRIFWQPSVKMYSLHKGCDYAQDWRTKRWMSVCEILCVCEYVCVCVCVRAQAGIDNFAPVFDRDPLNHDTAVQLNLLRLLEVKWRCKNCCFLLHLWQVNRLTYLFSI